MALPKIDAIVFEGTFPVLDTPFKYRPYNLAEEKALLFTIADEKQKDFLNNMLNISKACLSSTDVDLEKLTAIDFLYYSMMLRAKSKGENLILRRPCSNPECQKTFQFESDLEKMIAFRNKDVKKKVVELHSNLAIELTPNKMAYLRAMDSVEMPESEDDVKPEHAVAMINNSLLYSISKVIINQKIYTEFTEQELQEQVIDQLHQAQINQLLAAKKDLISMYMKIECICPACKTKNTEEINDFFEFLV